MNPLRQRLERQRAQGLYRSRRIIEGRAGVDVTLSDRRGLSFCSNDYLGLAGHPAVVEALRDGAARHGAGSGASHLVTGHGRAHHELEEALAAWTGRERALLFSTGYMANLGVLGALAGRADRVYEDRLNHASLLDAGLLCGARLRRYPHGDAGRLAHMLEDDAPSDAQRFIVTDGVFSMDGDLAPLPALAALAGRRGAWLMVDDAHGLGVIGPGGRGCLSHYGLDAAAVPILVGTLGKAFGTFGAFVAGEAALIESLIQFARTYAYTTALPSALACATRAALEVAEREPWRRERLAMLVTRFRAGAAQLGLPVGAPPASPATPIVPLILGESGRAMQASGALLERGLLVTAIRPPTVPKGSARLRVTFSAAHTEEQVDRLLDALAEVL
jgi:8-amino-7-oxononanoate synthase